MIRIKYQCSQRPTAGRINEQVVLREQFSVYSGGTVTALLGRRNKACQMTDTYTARKTMVQVLICILTLKLRQCF